MMLKRAFSVRLLSTSLLTAAAALASAPAFAKCTTTGTSTVCDANPPNPQQGPVVGGQVKVLNGSIVEDNGTLTPVVRIDAGGSLTTDAGSLVRSGATAGQAVSMSGATASVSGTLRTTGDLSATAFVAAGSTLTLNQGGLIENLGTLTSGNEIFVSTGIAAVGNSILQIDGTVRTTGRHTPGIETAQQGGFGTPLFSAATINIGATGRVETSGDTVSHGIYIGGGSTVTVAGSVVAHGAGSDGINATGGTSAAATSITVLAGGSVVSDQGIGINGGTNVRVSGLVSGATTAIATPATLTISTTAQIIGAVRAGSVNLVAEDANHLSGQLVPLGPSTRLNVMSGNWVAATGTSTFLPIPGSSVPTGVTIAQAASLEIRNPGGVATVQGDSFTVDGNLILNFANDATVLFGDPATNPLRARSIGGSGGLTFSGPATVTLGGTQNLKGQVSVLNGKLLIVSPVGGGLTIGSGATASAAETNAGFAIASLDNAGTFSFDRSVDGFINGAVRGNGAFIKNGAGMLTVSGVYGDTGPTTINQGVLRLAGGTDPAIGFTVDHGTLEFTATPATISALAGAAGGTVRIGSNVTLNQAGDTTFAGVLAGTGALVKSGAGKLTLSGTSSYSGPTTLSAGTLAVTGTLPSTVTVTGGRLEGTGTLGGLAASGGVVAPGGGIGTLNVSGGIAFGPGSIFEVDANAAGAADRIAASGAASLTGGTVQVLAQNGSYAPQTRYTILTAGGGVSGQFGSVTTSLAFLTPSLAYGANDVSLFLTRNDRSFASLATSPNELAVANAITALGTGNPIYVATLQATAAEAPVLYNSLSGEIYATLPALLADDSRAVRDALLSNDRHAPQGFSLWADGFTGKATADAQPGIAGAHGSMQGFITGVAYARDGFSAGLGGGLGNSTDRVSDRQSRAEIDSKFVGGHVGYTTGGFAIRGGGAWFWHDVSADRILYGTLGPASGAFNATGSRLFGEAEYDLLGGPTVLAPFLAYDRASTTLDGFAEAGGAGRLVVDSGHYHADFATGGVRFEAAVGGIGGATLVPRASVAYRHRLSESGNDATARFATGTSAFVITGLGVPRDAVDVEAGLDVQAGAFRIGARYRGSFADRWSDNGGALSLSLRF